MKDEPQNPDVQRLLGATRRHRQDARPRQRLGLQHHQAGRQLRRDLRAQRRPKTPLGIERGLNELWNKGGLHVRAAVPLSLQGRRPPAPAGDRPLSRSSSSNARRTPMADRPTRGQRAPPTQLALSATTRASAAIVYQVLVLRRGRARRLVSWSATRIDNLARPRHRHAASASWTARPGFASASR